MSFCAQRQCWQRLPCLLHQGQQFSVAHGALPWLHQLSKTKKQSLSESIEEILAWAQKQPEEKMFGEIRCLWCDVSRAKTKINTELSLTQIAWLSDMEKKYKIRTFGKSFRCVLDYAMLSSAFTNEEVSINVSPKEDILVSLTSPSQCSSPVEVIGTAQDLCDALIASRELLEVHMFQVWNEQRQDGLQGQSCYKIGAVEYSAPLLSIEFIQSDGSRSWTFSIEDAEVCMLKVLSREQKMFAVTISQAVSIEETNPSRTVTFDRGATAPAPADRMMYDKPAMYISGVFA